MTTESLPMAGPARGPLARGVLLRYRVMALTTATLLVVLVFVGIPLQVAAGRPQLVNVVGTLHGFLYIVYLYVAFSLTRRLALPKWQMALVLLAGTVPFAAFVAERKMTRRFEATAANGDVPAHPPARRDLRARAASFRKRWLCRRALLLHLEVAVVAPGCALAGWWQATRALAGNELSWVYSVEWPVFALLAIGGWWVLVHEDPEAYAARRARRHAGDGAAGAVLAPAALDDEDAVLVKRSTIRHAQRLAAAVGIELVLGVVAFVVVPFSRPSGWLPSKGAVVYLVHAVLGLLIALGAATFLARVLVGRGRISRIVGWMGFAGVGLAGVGGLLTETQSLTRLLGIALMFVGTVCAELSYLVPTFMKLQRKASPPLTADSSARA
jgi:integral membrane protein